MKRTAFFHALAVLAIAGAGPAMAQNSSVYSKLDFEQGCEWQAPESEEEAQMGGSAVCAGLEGYEVHFSEYDLRQSLAYGPASDPHAFPSGFGQWNSVHDTIEWRLSAGRPVATIHRWFIENLNPETGMSDKARRGQVLVVSTVADPSSPENARTSCVVGFIDALANGDSNVLARQVADNAATRFRCGMDRPAFYGNRGPLSGDPYALQD